MHFVLVIVDPRWHDTSSNWGNANLWVAFRFQHFHVEKIFLESCLLINYVFISNSHYCFFRSRVIWNICICGLSILSSPLLFLKLPKWSNSISMFILGLSQTNFHFCLRTKPKWRVFETWIFHFEVKFSLIPNYASEIGTIMMKLFSVDDFNGIRSHEFVWNNMRNERALISLEINYFYNHSVEQK